MAMFKKKNLKDPRMAAFFLGLLGLVLALAVTPGTAYAKAESPSPVLGTAMGFAIIALCSALVYLGERVVKIKE